MENIRLMMGERGLRAADLVRMTGLQASRLSKWFDGDGSPNIEQAHRMASALGTTIDALLGDGVPVSRVLTADELRVLGAFQVLGMSADEAIHKMGRDRITPDIAAPGDPRAAGFKSGYPQDGSIPRRKTV